MADHDPDPGDSDLPDLVDRDDVIRFLERNDVSLPDELSMEKI